MMMMMMMMIVVVVATAAFGVAAVVANACISVAVVVVTAAATAKFCVAAAVVANVSISVAAAVVVLDAVFVVFAAAGSYGASFLMFFCYYFFPPPRSCQEDVGQCPDMGGFRLGCKADADPDASEPLCHYSDNDLGTCECEGQFFLNADCTQGFYCHAESEGALAAGAEGCSRTCEAGYILEVDNSVEGDPRWICIDNFLGELECEGPSESKTQCVDDDDEDGAMANGVALAAVAAAGTMALIAR